MTLPIQPFEETEQLNTFVNYTHNGMITRTKALYVFDKSVLDCDINIQVNIVNQN